MLLQEKIYFALGWKSNCVTLKKLAFTAHFKESFEYLVLKISSLKSIIDSDDTRSPSIVVSICVDERLGGGGAARY